MVGLDLPLGGDFFGGFLVVEAGFVLVEDFAPREAVGRVAGSSYK